MKYKTSIKTRCIQCQIVRRHGKRMVRCSSNPRHNQTQG